MQENGKLKSAVDKTFKKSKSGGYKKLRTRIADGYTGLSNREMLKVTNNIKYKKFTRFTNKVAPKPGIASKVNSAYCYIYISTPFSQMEVNHKLLFKAFQETR